MQQCRNWFSLSLLLFAAYAYGQTSGATAPEVTSFEPVDITDLVNLSSGDFTYAVPVMAVPGAPGGNYPFALSYKAGVLHGQEATWVGLGWNLQAGSVSRFVRSFPDDYRGARITSIESYPSIYNYSVGLGYQGFNIGVNWDNHGGFGGSVGYAYSGGASAGLRYHNKTGFGANVGISGSAQGFGGRLGYDSSGDFSASASYAAAEGSQISIDSSGQVGYSSSAMPSATLSTNTQRFGSMRTESSQASVNIGIFNFGWGRTKSSRTDTNEAWGYIHLDKIGESDVNVERRRLDFANLTTGVAEDADTTEAQKQAFQTRIDSYDLNQTYQRRTRGSSIFSNNVPFSHVGIALDSHHQDFEQAYTTTPESEDDRDAKAHNSVYSADYITGSFDGYNVAAQGLAGMAKPVHQQRGFMSFSDSTSAVRVEDGKWFFNPYRTLYRLMETGELNWDTDFQTFFQSSDWAENLQDNMVMLSDPGLIMDQPFYGDAAGTLPTDPRNKRFATRNRGTRMRYELDEDGKIARITVRKADGMIYVFGLLQDQNGIVTAGARPNNLSETKYSRHTKNVNSSDEEMSQKEIKEEAYAYAWHLAAVTSPDFVDRAPVGHYGPEDVGEYITFHYSLTNPSYHWKTPYPKNDGPNGDTPYALVGRSAYTDNFHFERSEGVKDFYHLKYAKTRTHLAVFEHDYARRDNLSGVVNTDLVAGKTASAANSAQMWTENYIKRDQLVYLAGHHFRSATAMIQDETLRQAFYARFGGNLNNNVPNPQHYLVMFPAGTAEKLGLSQNQSYTVSMVGAGSGSSGADLTAFSDSLTYLGNWNYGHHDVFQVDLDQARPLPILTQNRHGVFNAMIVKARGNLSGITFNGSVRLKAIALFRRDNETNAVIDAGNLGSIQSLPSLTQFAQNTLQGRHISRVSFAHDYQLARGYQNVANEGTARTLGKLTLKSVDFQAAYSQQAMSHPYLFEYYDDPSTTTAREHYRKDPWGFPSLQSKTYASVVDNRPLNTLDPQGAPIQAADSLKSITTPVGTKITVDYERDRYAWVQDRAAVNRLLDLNRQDFGPVLASFERGAGGASPYKQADGKPVPLNTIYQLLRELTWAQPGAGDFSVWPYQVMVVAEGESRDDCPFIDLAGNCAESGTGTNSNANQHRFIIPAMTRFNNELSLPIVQTGMGPDVYEAGHPAVRELATWIWHEIDMDPGDLVNFKIYGVPGEAFDPDQAGPLPAVVVPHETDYTSNRTPALGGEVFIGEIAGGLRVKRLITEARQNAAVFGDDYVTTVSYDYTDPANGLDSGVIFADPDKYIHGIGGDRRIVRSEAYPYLNMAGAEVTYGSVTTQMVSGGRQSGYTRYTHHTARDARVAVGAFTQTVRAYPDEAPYRPSAGFTWGQGNPNTQFLRFETRVQNDLPWKAAAYNLARPLRFELDYQVRSRVVNNSGLIGLLAREERLDDAHNLVSRTTRYYQAAYDPERGGLPLRRFYRGEDNTLVEQDFFANQQVGSLDPLMPGAYVEKNAAMLIGRRDGDGYHFGVKALLQDEIWNSFHNLKTVTEFYPQAGENQLYHYQEKYTAALDFSTGLESITMVKSLGSGRQPIYEYQWQVPAHEIWDPQGVADGMKQQNMLTQSGYQLWARSKTQFNAAIPGDWLRVLNHSDTQIRGASAVHWHKNQVPGNDNRWVQSGVLNYRGNEAATRRSAHWTLPNLGDTTPLADSYRDDQEGVWEIANQITAYNRFGVPVEERNRVSGYLSKVYEPTGQQVIASFAGGRLDQIYYEGFDYLASDPNQVYPPTYQANLGYSLSRVPAAVGEPLSPEAYRTRLNYAYTGEAAARGQVTVTFRPSAAEEMKNGQTRTRSHFWLSFFVRKVGATQITVQHGGGTTTVPLAATNPVHRQDTLWVSKAQGDWYFVKLKLAHNAFGNLRLGDAGTLIDAVAIYPAAGENGLLQGSVSHFAYDPIHHQVAAMTDASGNTTRYQFNRIGELFRVYDTDGHLTTEHHRLPYKRLAGQ